MPVRCQFEEDDRLFVEIWTGTVTPEEEIAAVEEATHDPRLKSGLLGIVDLREANIPFGEEGLRKIFEHHRTHGEKFTGWRWAVLARTPQHLAIGALYEWMLHDVPTQMSVFQSEEEARDWLGLSTGSA